jgi:hypothetical protein
MFCATHAGVKECLDAATFSHVIERICSCCTCTGIGDDCDVSRAGARKNDSWCDQAGHMADENPRMSVDTGEHWLCTSVRGVSTMRGRLKTRSLLACV